jgi:hypothetical protein
LLCPTSHYISSFFRITQYIGDTHNARTFIPMNTHANPTPKSIFEDCAGKSSRLAKSPQAPRCRRERRLPLKAQTPLNPKKSAPTGSRTQDLRCYRGSCNHKGTGPSLHIEPLLQEKVHICSIETK